VSQKKHLQPSKAKAEAPHRQPVEERRERQYPKGKKRGSRFLLKKRWAKYLQQQQPGRVGTRWRNPRSKKGGMGTKTAAEKGAREDGTGRLGGVLRFGEKNEHG